MNWIVMSIPLYIHMMIKWEEKEEKEKEEKRDNLLIIN
jgi:hypothetical protein